VTKSRPARGDQPGELGPDGWSPGRELREIDPELPEADVLAQHTEAVPGDFDDEPATLPPDASEADALDQSRVVLNDDEP
jgi:hypothetical protein